MNFIIENTQVYGLDRAIKASGNPMRTRFNRDIVSDKDILRAEKLGNASYCTFVLVETSSKISLV